MVTQERRDKTYSNLCAALAEWRKVLEEDLETHYERSPNWSQEDEQFLEETISVVSSFQEKIGAEQTTLPPE